MNGSTLLAAATALMIGAVGVQAQGFPGGGGGFPGGGMSGGRGGFRGGSPAGGSRFGSQRPSIPDLGNPLHLILQNKDSLELTAAETTQVDSMARALDQRNAPLLAQVRRAFGRDSASVGPGSVADPNNAGALGNSDDQRAGEAIALRDRLNVLKPTFDRIKKNDDQAWKDATKVLDKKQRKQADKLRNAAEKQREQRWSPASGRGPAGGRRGGRFPGGGAGGGEF